MRHASVKALYAYWNRLRGKRAAPARAEVDPRELAAHLGDVFLLDDAASGHALRLSGSRMEAELGGPLSGRPFGALFGESARREALQALATATYEGEPLLLGVRLEQPAASTDAARPDSGQWVRPHWNNRRWPTPPVGQAERRARTPGAGEMLLLPLEHRGIIGARVLGVFGLLTPSQHLPVGPVPLHVTGQRMLSAAAMATRGPELSPGATVVSRGGVLSYFRGMVFPPTPRNDA